MTRVQAPDRLAAVALPIFPPDRGRIRASQCRGRQFVPVLVADRCIITENTAILLYIAQTFPDSGLLPSNDAFGMAVVTSFNTFLASSVHITYRHLSMPRLFADGEVPHAALAAKVPEMLTQHFGLIEQQLSDGRPWIHGDRYTVSDPYLFVYSSHLFWKGKRVYCVLRRLDHTK
jgi:glutathione S-transferase